MSGGQAFVGAIIFAAIALTFWIADYFDVIGRASEEESREERGP